MLKDIQSTGKKDTRSGFGDGIVEAARSNPNIIALTADLAGSMKLNQFMKEFPERFIQVGIAEANTMGIAAGSRNWRQDPFHHYFCQFLHWPCIRSDPSVHRLFRKECKDLRFTRRPYAGRWCYPPDPGRYRHDENVARYDGDRSLRLQPDQTGYHGCCRIPGPCIPPFRTSSWPIFTDLNQPFVIGKAQQFSEGTDVSIFACGHMVVESHRSW